MLGTLMSMATSFEANRINGAVHFWLSEDIDDLLVQGGVFGQVHYLKTLGFRMRQTRWV
ncbi:hypothetical protein D3C76_1723250 [compost metagenome]